jgi:beta-ureidopropionase / N-carbamoyl-L-amino-acid hydrolase
MDGRTRLTPSVNGGVSRRAFLASAAALALPMHASAGQRAAAAIDPARLRARLEQLSVFGRPEGGTFASGVSRVAYSDADVAGRQWLLAEIRAAGFVPRIDPAGNVFVRWEPAGAIRSRPPILFGSHIDSVPSGGNFDGDLGTLSALEVLQACRTSGIRLRHPLEMVLWAHEESTAFGHGTAASRIVAGDLKAGVLDQEWNGMTRAAAIRRIGGDPARIGDAVRPRGAWHAYLELHIEQGGTLDQAKVPIGVVEGIVSIHRYDVVVNGVANHAGTTPMPDRKDALLAAADVVRAVREVVVARPGPHVGTVGRLEVSPNSPNVIPGRVTLSVELRDLSETTLAALAADIRRRVADIVPDRGVEITMTMASRNPPALADSGVQSAIARAAANLSLPTRRLPSGAGHDAQMMAALCPMGMIFVPSIGGISHSPDERTSWDDCAQGAAVLLGAVLDLDGREAV